MNPVDLIAQLHKAEGEAWKNLARYKFWMFGYFAGRWVFINSMLPRPMKRTNPFRELVSAARLRAAGHP